MALVTIDGNEYHYRISKRGIDKEHAVVCLHGAGADGLVWGYQISRLSKHFKIIVPDLPGHGRSGGKPLTSVKKYSAWFDQFTTALGLSSFFVIGHSFGGAIVQEYARAHSDKIRGLVLVGTSTVFRLSRMYRKLYEKGIDLLAEDAIDNISSCGMDVPDSFKRGLAMLREMGNDALQADLLAAGLFDSSDWISSIKQPVLIIWGADDVITARDLPEEMNQRLPGSELCIIPKAGHVVMIDRRNAFNEAVKDFIDKLSALP
ncbi:MAG: alpha/beta hydrolase [Thermodesulfobacteriota bacterium]|nr:alpha/beta hydrolase [Thermodesulfobacteriota bacterium]